MSENDRAKNPVTPLTVSELTHCVKVLLEAALSPVCVVGEVSSLRRQTSGHLYFTLKDSEAQCPAVMWQSVAAKLRLPLKDGDEVICRGRLEVYVPHGRYQLIVSSLEPRGTGTQEQQFRLLHQRLTAEGLFDITKKRPLPQVIRRIAVVTSPTGAAVRDFLQILLRRTQRISVIIVPTRVQGIGAAQEIVERLKLLNTLAPGEIDAIVVTRGGGSAEDLQAFNEECVARAVAAAAVPVVSAIGHEIDVTLCDCAADVRAFTPSEAAEKISPLDSALKENLAALHKRLQHLFARKIELEKTRLSRLARHHLLQTPEHLLTTPRQKLDDYETRLGSANVRRQQESRQRMQQLARTLETLSPLGVLNRGYSITCDESGKVLHSPEEIHDRATLITNFADGILHSRVMKTSPEKLF